MFARKWSLIRRELAQFFPPACAGCDGVAPTNQAFCAICYPLAYRLMPPHCARCQVPMAQLGTPGDTNSECSRCHRNRPSFEKVWALWEYDDAVADAIRRIKYGGDLAALRALCRGARPWFQHRLEALDEDIPLVAMPSHGRELRRRGFHVPSLALTMLCDRHRRHRIAGGLTKNRPTVRQASLSFEGRRKNVRGVFSYTGSQNATGPIILFDDVVTTGATADAASEVLIDAGFDEVYVICLARAPVFRPS